MAGIGSTYMTLADHAKFLDPEGKAPAVVEMLEQTNELLTVMPWKEGNLPMGHRNTIRTSNPTVGVRRINQGTVKSKSTYAQSDEACAIIDGNTAADVKLMQFGGNEAAIRMSEAKGFMESMSQEQQRLFFYGDVGVDDREYTGVTPRYNSLSGTTAQNVISGGSVSGGDATSVWLFMFNEDFTGIFPKGSKAGIQHRDLGVLPESDGNGGEFLAYKDFWSWDCGISVGDWRQAVRLCNIDVSALVANSSATDLIEGMSRMIDRLPLRKSGKMFFAMNRTVKSILRLQALRKSTNAVTVKEAISQFDTEFLGIPICIVDAISSAEATVS